MTRKSAGFALTLVGAFAFCLVSGGTGCGTTAKPTVRVLSFAPKDLADNPRAVARIRFDKPVIDLHQIGKPILHNAPIRVTPSIKVMPYWMDRQTLAVKPLEPLHSSTRYTIELVGSLGDSVGKSNRTFSFVHDPLRVTRIQGIDLAWVSPKPTFQLHFSQPVVGREVALHCTLDAGEASTRVDLRAKEPSLISTAIPLSTSKELISGSTYKLRCQGVRPNDGNEPLRKPFSETFHVYPLPQLKEFTPNGGAVAPDQARLRIKLTTPVETTELQKYLAITPDVPEFHWGWYRQEDTEYEVELSLQADTEYKVALKKGLRDQFGQTLNEEKEFVFRTTDALPTMSLEKGIFAMERQANGYPVWTRNVHEVSIDCAAVPKGKVVKLLTTDMNYDPWYDADAEQLHWDKLGLRKQSATLSTAHAKNQWQLQSLDLPKLCKGTPGKGLYLAEIQSEEVRNALKLGETNYPYRVLTNITNLGVLLKVGPASGLVWVTEIATGAPVGSAAVSVFDPKGKRVFSGATDEHGVLRTPGSTELLRRPGRRSEDEDDFEFDEFRPQRVIVTVEKGDDLAVIDGNWQNGIQAWNFGVGYETDAGTTRIRGFIQSDRGIYRPGETVHFKGLVREIALGSHPRVPSAKEVRVSVLDARHASVMETNLPLTPFGGFSFDFPLGEEASLGDYYVRAAVDSQTFREQFSVEEFRSVSFEIRALDLAEHVRLGQKLQFNFKADYLFGAPVSDAAVHWQVQRRQRWLYIDEYPQYSFSDWAANDNHYEWFDRDDSLTFVSDGETKTNREGRFGFAVTDPETHFDASQDYTVQASVTDPTDQTVTKRAVVSAHRSDFYLGLHTQEGLQAVNMPFAVQVIAIKPDGGRVATDARIHLLQRRWKCSHQGAYRTFESCEAEIKTLWSRNIQVPATGSAVERITPDSPGEFVIRVEAKDSHGTSVFASSYMWALGEGEAFWSGDESARMSLVTSKQKYSPGDTAIILPRADTRNSTMLVTVERDGIIDAFVQSGDTASSGIQIPLHDAHAPNVFVSMAMVKGRTGEGDSKRPRFKMGVIDLKVTAEAQRLKVDVKTDKTDYEPGETVRGTLRVTSGATPVQAEVSLSAADEGVLQLIAYKTPDPMNSFYASWGLGIDNATNWNRISRLADPRDGTNEEGADAGGTEREPKIRSRFVSSAFWAPTLVTNEQGEVSFSFEAPDNLTAFRLMAVAADQGARFGSSDARIRVSKKLLAKPVLPRFFVEGDQAEIGVVVYNYTDREGAARVAADFQGATPAHNEQTVTIPAGESARVGVRVRVGRAPHAKAKFAVHMGSFRDDVEVSVPVERLLFSETQVLGTGKVQGDAQVQVQWPESTLPRESVLEVSVDRTGLSGLERSLEYLIHYPYGCLEQTLSTLIPLLKVKDLATTLHLEELKGPKLDRFIKAGIAKVLRHQTDDGNFSLWPGGETEAHYTAYALYGLIQAERAHAHASPLALMRGLRAVREWANGSDRNLSPGGEISTMAMVAYLLAEKGIPDIALHSRLFAARNGLTMYGKAFLLRAMLQAGPSMTKEAKVLAEELESSVTVDGDRAVAREASIYNWYWSSDVRSSALVMSALFEMDPHHPLIEKLALGLKEKQTHEGRWGNTQENQYALVALAEYARERARGSSEVEVKLSDRVLAKKTLKGTDVLRIEQPLYRIEPGTLTVHVTGDAFYSANLRLKRNVSSADAKNQGMTITRSYQDFETDQPISTVRVGDLVKVKLVVTMPENQPYVAVVAPFPAGFEAVNTRLATEVQVQDGESRYLWDYIDLRDDRVHAFSNRFWNRSATLEYVLRATLPGTFRAAPSLVEAMYSPDLFARTDASVLSVQRRSR